MARPTVLVATTNPAMAYALQASLKDKCKSLGLKLDICPDGDESNLGGETVRTYDSAEALFDALEKRAPMVLADTLVVLDVGTEQDNAFRPAASEDQKWHVTKNRAGIAVELLLRFPQVFPVFLSPAVPITGNDTPTISSCFNDKLRTGNEVDKCETGCWKGFCSLQENLAVGKNKSEALDIQHLLALAVPLHFVSPLDGGNGLNATLTRFANGMRCWFDPTGLRTLVKNRFLGTVFGNGAGWENTWPSEKNPSELRKALLERINKMSVAVDEEREFALLSAYASWKYGRRAWLVTTYVEFDKGLWSKQQLDRSLQQVEDVIILRDVDLRFPDVNTSVSGIREKLKDIGTAEWVGKIGEADKAWYVRAVSGDADVEDIKCSSDANKVVGQNPPKIEPDDKVKYYGARKPIGSLYELKRMLGKKAEDAGQTLQSRIGAADDSMGSGGHGAPYSNLAMAEALLRYSSVCKDRPSAHLIGAFLAMEAYELLMGMSKTTALEALLTMHKHEAAAEVSFPGVSHSLKIEERRKDIEATLNSLYTSRKGDVKKIKSIFLSQFWAELRIQYKDGEQFDAAEEANTQVLLNSYKCLPKLLLQPAVSLRWWLGYVFFLSILFAVLYALPLDCEPTCDGILYFLHIWWEVVMSMLSMQSGGDHATIKVATDSDGFLIHIIQLFHIAVSYLMLGLLISMLYRKITRS